MSYKQGTFGYWWTIVKGNKDIKGKICNIDIDCHGLGLISLNGAPKIVKGYFNCSNNKLKNLKGGPKKVNGSFLCYNNKLKNLKGAPKIVRGYFNCSNNKLKNLKGSPKESDSFDCSNNKLKNLKGVSNIIKGNFYCSFNDIKSFKYVPKICYGNFWCENNKLLKDVSNIFAVDIKKEFICDIMTNEEYKKGRKLYLDNKDKNIKTLKRLEYEKPN